MGLQFCTPFTIPIARGYLTLQFSAVAALMHTNVAKIAENYYIDYLAIIDYELRLTETYIARDVLILLVFTDVNYCANSLCGLFS